MDSSALTLWSSPFPIEGVSGYFNIPCFTEIPVFNANSVDPDQPTQTCSQKCEGPMRLITETCLYNFNPLKPHFYIGKLGFIEV